MPRSIDAERFSERFDMMCDAGGVLAPVTEAVREMVKKLIKAEPTVDVQEVRHGHWINGNCGDYVCSVCGWAFSDELPYMAREYDAETEEIMRYCMHCGSRLELQGGEEMDIYEEIKKIKEENAALRAKVEELTGRNAADEKRIAEVIKDIMSRKDEPDCKGNRENCVMLNIVAEGTEEPYYMIEYYDKRDNTYHQGFGSKNFKIVKAYQKAYFEKWDRGYFEKHIEELEDKHWEECRQIALYDDELKNPCVVLVINGDTEEENER